MAALISKKYVKALMEVAQEKNLVAALLAEVSELIGILTETKAFDFFASRIVPETTKDQALETVFSQCSEPLKNFLKVIALNGRFPELAEILKAFKLEAEHELGVAEVQALSAVPLTEIQSQKVTELVKSKFSLNDVWLTNPVDEGLLGGFIISSPGKVIDASLKTQLQRLAAEII